jgi:predicted metal-dependent peptidase
MSNGKPTTPRLWFEVAAMTTLKHSPQATPNFLKARAHLRMSGAKGRFIGTLAMSLIPVIDRNQKTAATDGTHVFYNPDYLDSLTEPKRVGLLVHETLHPMLLHHTRRNGRDPEEWNVAADLAINPGIIADGWELPDGFLIDPQYAGLSAEEIFRLRALEKQQQQPPQPEPEPDQQPDADQGDADQQPDADDSGNDPGDADQGDDSAGDNSADQGDDSGDADQGDASGGDQSDQGDADQGDASGGDQSDQGDADQGDASGGDQSDQGDADQGGGQGESDQPGDADADQGGGGQGNDSGADQGDDSSGGGQGKPGADQGNGNGAPGNGPGNGKPGNESASPDASAGQGNGNGADQGDATAAAPRACPDPGMCGGVIDAAPAFDPAEIAKAEADMKQRIRQAVAVARREGAGKLPGDLERIVADLNRARIDWRDLLSRFVDQSCNKSFAWHRPNRRYLSSGHILPSLISDRPAHIVAIVDSSGSMDSAALAVLLGELQTALDNGAADKITVAYADTRLRESQEYMPGDTIESPVMPRGGTDFAQPMAWAAENCGDASGLIYLTDADCDSWGTEPGFPVLWLVTGDPRTAPHYAARAPYGETVIIEA